jgi:hypothetical protein
MPWEVAPAAHDRREPTTIPDVLPTVRRREGSNAACTGAFETSVTARRTHGRNQGRTRFALNQGEQIVNPVPREQVERAARVYHRNADASAALGITMRAFSRACRRYGIETPYVRRRRERGSGSGELGAGTGRA